MKILLVAIPNHHFFQWLNQLESAGYDVYWFDITDGGKKVEKLHWVTQIKGWKLKWDFPFRHSVKARLPKLYKVIQKLNERNFAAIFEQKLQEIKPDIVQCFEMKLAGLPILSVVEKYKTIPFVYNSWGSDLFFYIEMGVSQNEVQRFFKRINYFISDCERDYKIAVTNGFQNTFLGVFPGNGGITFNNDYIKAISERDTILIKGYADGVGKAIEVLKAIENIPLSLLEDKKMVVFSADQIVSDYLQDNNFFKKLNTVIIKRNAFIVNEELLKIMGESLIYIGNSISDGMPNSLLEAMGMGAFPIQSNPGGVTEEVIANAENGFLIQNPLAISEITALIETALQNDELRTKAQKQNIYFIQNKYDRATLQPKIVSLYASIYDQSKK